MNIGRCLPALILASALMLCPSREATEASNVQARQKQLNQLIAEEWEYEMQESPVFVSFIPFETTKQSCKAYARPSLRCASAPIMVIEFTNHRVQSLHRIANQSQERGAGAANVLFLLFAYFLVKLFRLSVYPRVFLSVEKGRLSLDGTFAVEKGRAFTDRNLHRTVK